MGKPGRKPNLVRTEPLTVALTPKLHQYLADLVVEEGYGLTPPDVAARLIQEGLDQLIKDGIIKRRAGKFRGAKAKPA
jgi:hypothetical protein